MQDIKGKVNSAVEEFNCFNADKLPLKQPKEKTEK
jgi:hypothetical protein